MNDTNRIQVNTRMTAAAVTVSLGILAAAPARAAEPADDWQFRAIGYAFIPDVAGTARFPSGGTADIDIAADDLLRNTELAGMAAFELQKGRFGGFIDVMYFNVGDSVNDASRLGAGSLPLPPGITADAALDIEATIVTVGASYRALTSEATSVDLVVGARLLDAEATLDWAFSIPFGPFVGPAQAGTATVADDALDGIVGLKGERSFGASNQWFVPFYADIGAGDADLTWQAATGIGRRFSRSELVATYRYLRYEFGGNRMIEDLDFSGPAIGLSFRW